MSKNIKRLISILLSFLMIASSIIVNPAYADIVSQPEDEDLYKEWGSPVVQLDNGTIRITSDKQTGRFIVETLSGLPNKSADDYKDLLYGNRFESPETSYTSVRIDGEDFIYGNDYGFLGLQGHYTVEPYVDFDTNSIVSQWSINDILVTQRLKLTQNPNIANIGNVFVSYDIVNNGNAPKSVGLRMLLDTKIGTVDSPALTIPGGGFIYKEKEFTGDDIPSSWYAYDQFVTPQIIALGAVSGEGLSKPDKLQFAAWGDVSQTKWAYDVNPEKPIIEVKIDGVVYDGENGIYPPDGAVVDYAAKDSCAVMYWEPVSLNQGETKIIDTSYGVGDASIKDNDPGFRLSLQGTDKLNMNKEKTNYTTEYVNAEFNVDNNFDNSKNIANFQIELELPDELMLVEGEKKTVLKELKAGTYHRSIWKIEPVVQEDFKISAYSVLLRAEGMPAQRITKVLIMEGKQGGMPDISFLDSTPKSPFYYEDTNRNVFINGSGFNLFGNAIGQVMEATLIQGSKKYSLDYRTFKKISDTVISVGIPDNLPLGAYDLFVSVSDATGNKNDQKTFKNAVEISKDIKYSLNLVSEITFPIVMKEDGYNTPEEEITIYGKFIDNKNGTYTSMGADEDNPVRINNTLKYAGGTLTINTDPINAFIEASDGILWCDIINERNKTAAQAIIATSGFRFEAASEIGDNDTFVRMVYDIDSAYSDTMYDVSYQSVPVTLDTVTITSEGLDIKGSMGILNPLTYGTNDFIPETIDMDGLSLGFYKAEVDNISISQEGMDIEGKFKFKMPFAISLVAGSNAILEINTREEHLVIEVEVSIGKMVSEERGAKARIGLRKGRFDEIYVAAEFPKPIAVAPPVPIGLSGLGGGLSNLSFEGAFPITIIIGVFLEDLTGLEVKGYNLLSAEGEISMSPFHLEGEAEADLYMIDLAEVYTKFIWETWDPTIEKRGIIVDAVIHYKIFNGKIYIQYLEGESFLGRGELAVAVPQKVPVIGGLEVAGVIVEVTEYSIAGSIYALEQDVGVRYYFSNGRTEFLELKEELESSNQGLIFEYDDNCIAQYGFNYTPIEFTQHADADSHFITELNLTNNSNVMLILRMTEEQFNNLDENSVKIVKPGIDGLTTVKYIDNAALLNSDGTIKTKDELGLGENEIIAVKQLINNTAEGFSNEYMVTIPITSPENGLWTIITNGPMELLPYSTMKNSEITELSTSFDSTSNTLTTSWRLEGEPDKFRFYVVSADEVSQQELNNPASLWGKGSLLYGQTVTTKDYIDSSGNTVQVEDEIIYTSPTKDGDLGSYTSSINLSTGSYYVYAKTDKENTVSDYAVSKFEVINYNTPDVPSGLAIKDIGNNKISISWDADYNMDEYYIYRKNSANETYELGLPLCIYKVYDPLDYAPDYDNWPGNLPTERMDKFEVIVDGDIIDPDKPENKTYYYDLRAVGMSTMGVPASGSVIVEVPEEIISYTEFKSADSKIYYSPYVEKDLDGVEHRYYKYVTNSPNIIISGMSNIPVSYSIQRDGNKLAASDNFAMSYSEKVALKEGINYFIITYKNEHGDTLVEEYIAEYDNKSPSLVVLEPKEGTVTQNGKITVTGVTDPYMIVTINNVNYYADVDGKFSATLDFGNSFLSKIKIEARDSVNNVTTREISVLNDQAKVEDITVVPEYKRMATGTRQQLSTFISSDDDLDEKIDNSSVKYSIVQGSQFASIDENGVISAKYEGIVVAKSEFFLTDTVSLSDSIVIDVTGDEYHGSARYYPPVFSRDMFTWLAGSSMSTNGGTIKTADGVILSVPKGALPYYQDNIDIFIYNDMEDLLSEMNISEEAMAASNPYFISLVTDFIKPAKLTLPVSGFNKAFVYYYDRELGALIYKGGVMSPDNSSVTADITRPGTYIALNYPLQNIFTDIPSNYWGYDYVYGLNYLGVINGYNENGTLMFKPDGKITRAEFIKLLVASQNINISEAEDLELKFADIQNIPDWALPYIKAAVMHGLVNGKNIDGKIYISAGDFITREEIATIIGRAINSDARSGKIFNDNSHISTWASEEIKKLVELGIISGYEDNTFKPRNNAARVEAAVMIYKTLIQYFSGDIK